MPIEGEQAEQAFQTGDWCLFFQWPPRPWQRTKSGAWLLADLQGYNEWPTMLCNWCTQTHRQGKAAHWVCPTGWVTRHALKNNAAMWRTANDYTEPLRNTATRVPTTTNNLMSNEKQNKIVVYDFLRKWWYTLARWRSQAWQKMRQRCGTS